MHFYSLSLQKQPGYFQKNVRVHFEKPIIDKFSPKKNWIESLLIAVSFLLIFGVSIKLFPQVLLVTICFLMFLSALFIFYRIYKHQQITQYPSLQLIGNVLEHQQGKLVKRLALNRSILSFAATAQGRLVVVIDDGKTSLVIGRRAEPYETMQLPVYKESFLEIDSTDFEQILLASHRQCAYA